MPGQGNYIKWTDPGGAGGDAAFHGLVDRYAGEMYRLAIALIGNAADAEDILQETFAGALQGLKSFEGRASLRTWLTQILVRQVARRHRSRAVRKTVPLDTETASARTPSVEMRMDVLAALDTLSPERREAIVLREFHGMSYDEIAEVTGTPRGTVESRIFRARQELKERLKAYGPGEG